MDKEFALIGAGGHAKVIIEIIEEMGGRIAAVNDLTHVKEVNGYPVTGALPAENLLVIIAVGNNKTRKKIAQEVNNPFGTAIHPAATVSRRCMVGEGTVVMAGATVNSCAQIGKHCIINTNASVDHDCVVGDFVHISPGASVAGGVTIGEGTQVAIGASVIPGIQIGKWATIGAGAVVIKNVTDYAVVTGVPGEVIKYNEEV